MLMLHPQHCCSGCTLVSEFLVLLKHKRQHKLMVLPDSHSLFQQNRTLVGCSRPHYGSLCRREHSTHSHTLTHESTQLKIHIDSLSRLSQNHFLLGIASKWIIHLKSRPLGSVWPSLESDLTLNRLKINQSNRFRLEKWTKIRATGKEESQS